MKRDSMKHLLALLGLAVLTPLLPQTALGKPLSHAPTQPPPQARLTPAASSEPLYKQEGSDPSFETLLERGVIKPGDKFSKGPVLGSRIHVNHKLLEKQVGKIGPIPQNIGLHTEVCGDSIGRKGFDKWTRWYQEDHNVQVFRLFEGEQNVRGSAGEKGSPGRVEVFTTHMPGERGAWHEWEGTYSIIQPVQGCIFQLMHAGSLWPIHIQLNDKGDISYFHRKAAPDREREVVMAENMVGKSLSIKVRANGEDYEVYQKAPLDDGPWKLATKGAGPKAKNSGIQFRWGMYCGSKKGHTVPNDAMIFVTGVSIR